MSAPSCLPVSFMPSLFSSFLNSAISDLALALVCLLFLSSHLHLEHWPPTPPPPRTHSHTCLLSSTVIGLHSHWMAEWPPGLAIIRKLLSFSPFWFPPDVPQPDLQLFKVHLCSSICFFSGFTVILSTSSSMNPFVVLKWTVLIGWTSSPLVISA